MDQKVFVLCGDDALRERITEYLHGASPVVFCAQAISDLAGCLEPQERAMILFGIQDEHYEEGCKQLFELQKLYPSAQVLLLPTGADENFEFAIEQAQKVMQIKMGDRSGRQREEDR